MGYKLFVNVRTYNELRNRLGDVSLAVHLEGVDGAVATLASDAGGDADVTIDRSGDQADAPPLAYCYASKGGFCLAAAWLGVNPQGFYSGEEQFKTFLAEGSFILIGDAQAPPPPPEILPPPEAAP